MKRPTLALLSLSVLALSLGGCTTSTGIFAQRYDYSAPAPTKPARLNLALASGDLSGVTAIAKQMRRAADPTTPAYASVPVLAE